MTKPYQVLISAETQNQANRISNHLLNKKLIVGATIVKAPSKFWWKGKIIKMGSYCYVQALTTAGKKERIISEVENISKEEVPMIFFFAFEPNKKFLDWIERSVH